jgi:hypothetical protein
VTEGAKGPQIFSSRDECQEWIKSRVIRFSYVVSKVALPGVKTDKTTFIPDMWTTSIEKDGGVVLDPTQPDYANTGMDEPLSKYARPVRQGREWVAFMGQKKK